LYAIVAVLRIRNIFIRIRLLISARSGSCF
jgi:hypothetical protein